MVSNDSKPKSDVRPPHKQSGTRRRIDLSSVHDDERAARAPWDALLGCSEGHAELRMRDAPVVERRLPVEDVDQAVVEALRTWLGEQAVGHWHAIRSLASQNGRALWKIDAHMTAIGAAPSDREARVRVSREVERLAGLEMTVYTPGEHLRLRAPLLTPLATTERRSGEVWVLDDMILRFHPLLGAPSTYFPMEGPTQPTTLRTLAPPTDPAPPLDAPIEEATITEVKPGRGG